MKNPANMTDEERQLAGRAAPSPYPPALVERMVAHLRECGKVHNIRPQDPEARRRYDEMKEIVSELPEVVQEQNLETTIQAAMGSGNDVTAFEIAQAVEEFLAGRELQGRGG